MVLFNVNISEEPVHPIVVAIDSWGNVGTGIMAASVKEKSQHRVGNISDVFLLL